MLPETIAIKARNSISNYCVDECKAFCCRKGYLELSSKEMRLAIGSMQGELEHAGFLTEVKYNEFILNMSAPNGCPSLRNDKCLIHLNIGRSSACKKFPIFISNNIVRFSARCPAVGANKFYSYISKFKKLGFIIE